jgi:hypothetical protein
LKKLAAHICRWGNGRKRSLPNLLLRRCRRLSLLPRCSASKISPHSEIFHFAPNFDAKSSINRLFTSIGLDATDDLFLALRGRENAFKVATHLAVLESMDKKTGPRYQPRLNILGCFTVVHAFRTDKPQKPACAMVLPAHTGLKHSIASGMELPA